MAATKTSPLKRKANLGFCYGEACQQRGHCSDCGADQRQLEPKPGADPWRSSGLSLRSSASGSRAFEKRRAIFALAGYMVLLAGCAGSAPPATFNLAAPTQGFSASRAHGVLVVARPTATAPVDTDRIVVRTGPASIAYLRGAQWVEPLPGLVQDKLIEAFENAKLIRSVVRPGDNLNANYELVTDVRRFDIDAASGQAVVQISAKIADVATGKIVAGQIFTGRAAGSAQQGATATRALNDAMNQVFTQIVDWAAARA
jgi:cholesterol transport system auxiliary component